MSQLSFQNLQATPQVTSKEEIGAMVNKEVNENLGSISPENIGKTIEGKYAELDLKQAETASATKLELQEIIQKSKNDFEARAVAQQADFIQLIGLFTAVLALITVSVHLIRIAKNFFEAISLVISLTCSIAIFASLIYWFFSKDSSAKAFWPVTISILILAFMFYLSWKDQQKSTEIKTDELSSELSPEAQ